MNENDSAVTEPATRSLEELIGHLEASQKEVNFQIMRLGEHVKARTTEEEEYHNKLREGYDQTQYWLGVLIRYHKGRFNRIKDRVEVVSGESDHTGPFMDEEKM